MQKFNHNYTNLTMISSFYQQIQVFLFTIAFAFIGNFSYSEPQNDFFVQVYVDPSSIISQQLYSNTACAPTAILNALKFGNETLQSFYSQIEGNDAKQKLHSIIEQFGHKNSHVDAQKALFDKNVGMKADDILPFYNYILEHFNHEPVQGLYFDKLSGEATQTHLQRIHRLLLHSIKNGYPPVISLRSFAAQKDTNDNTFKWQGVSAHVIVITKIPASLEPFQKGFSFTFIDPDSATLSEGYLHIEEMRRFAAIKGSSETNFVWLDGSPFLLVTSPILNLNSNQQEWYCRTLITLNYGVGRF